MSNWVIIPDVHGRKFWRSAVQGHEEDKIIFLGDYVDPYDWEEILPMNMSKPTGRMERLDVSIVALRYAEYNKKYFSDLLKAPRFRLFCGRQSMGGYMYKREIYRGRITRVWGEIIELALNVKWTEAELEKVLVHEMIHQYIHTVLHREPFFSHGRLFHKECYRLRRDYGLRITVFCDITKLEGTPKRPKRLAGRLRWFIENRIL